MRNLFRKAPPYITVPGQARPAAQDKEAEGLWVRCENERCRELLYVREFENNLNVCHKCDHHARLSARERIRQLVDEGTFTEHDAELAPADPLAFAAAGASYRQKLAEAATRSGEREAAIAGSATLDGLHIQILVLDFAFMGASMGSVVGEKIARAADRASQRQAALVLWRALRLAEERLAQGERQGMRLAATLRDCIAKEPLARIDYSAVCDLDTLWEVEQLSGTVLVALAVYIGKTRLIDNAVFSVGD